MIHLSLTLDAPVILNSSLQDRGSFYWFSWDVAIILQYTKTRCPDGSCMSPPDGPLAAPLGVSRHCLQAARACRPGGDGCGLYGCFAKMCEMGVWVLRVLAQLGVYCAEDWDPCWHPWSPPLTQKLCFTPSVFLSASFSLSLFLSVACVIPFFSFLFALSHSKRIWRVLLAAVWFNWIHTWRLVVDGSGDRSLSLCFIRVN